MRGRERAAEMVSSRKRRRAFASGSVGMPILAALAFISAGFLGRLLSVPTVGGPSRDGSDAPLLAAAPSPYDAPLSEREAVVLGYRIVTETRRLAPDYVGNGLECRNCHFRGGLTAGGRGGGVSFLTASAAAPGVYEKAGPCRTVLDLANDCFVRNLNGRRLPYGSPEMLGLAAYFQWIARAVPERGQAHFPAAPRVGTAASPAPVRDLGQPVFSRACAACHGPNGNGTRHAPPLWGPSAFSDRAGLARLDALAGFVGLNMPLERPRLSTVDASAAAAFVLDQSRPHLLTADEGQAAGADSAVIAGTDLRARMSLPKH